MTENKTTRVVRITDPYDIWIGRPGRWGNPFVLGIHGTRDGVCDKHDLWLEGKIEAPDGRKPPSLREIQKYLTGKRLGCPGNCPPRRCHGDNYVKRIKTKDISTAEGLENK